MGKDTKIILGVILATVIVVIGGVLLTSKNQNKPVATANPNLLIRENSIRAQANEQKAVLVEFGDLQCPACGAYHPLIKQAKEEFKDNVTYVFRHFPLTQHKNAKVAAYALEASGMQDKYWEMQDKLYDSQDEWSNLPDPTEKFVEYAKSFKLNETKFRSDMDSSIVKKKVDEDFSDGTTLKVDSTPTFFLNGVKISLFNTYDELKKAIEDAINQNPLTESVGEEGYHTHFDIKIYANNSYIDLSQDKYQSKEGQELNPDIHLHDGNGKVVHIHKEGVTLGDLLSSLKLNLEGKLYVGGVEVKDMLSYKPSDLDQIVIISGNVNESQTKTILASVSNDACIYSGKCPQRGTPPSEECVGGIGTGCK